IPAVSANLTRPQRVTADADGNVFVSDIFDNRIRRIDATTGLIATVAGTGEPGYNGDGRPGDTAMIYFPTGMRADGDGNLYFTDTGNIRVRRVDAATGMISTVFGSGAQ